MVFDPIFDWFSGGRADVSGLQGSRDIMAQLLSERMADTGPTAQEMAARQAMEQQRDRLFAQQAGMRGPQAAAAQQRMSAMIPLFAAQQAQQQQQAARAGEEQRLAALQALWGQQQQAEQALFAAQEAERRRKGEMRQQAVSGLFDIGTTVAGGM